MIPAPYTWRVTQGDDETLAFTVRTRAGTAVDLTGWSALLHIRAAAEDADALVELAGTVDGAAGRVSFELAAADSAALPEGAVYDVQLTDTLGKKHTYMAGSIVARREVTR